MAYESSVLDPTQPTSTASMNDTTPLNAIKEGSAEKLGIPTTSPSSNIGVYVRQPANTQRELDVLWSNSRQFHKEDRSPIVFTVAGLLLGVMIASAVFFLMSQKPEISTTQDPNTVTAVQDAELLAEENNIPAETVAQTTSPAEEESAANAVQQAESEEAVTVKTAPQRSVVADSLVNQSSRRKRSSAQHRVEPGDTLGGIAYKYYGASTPALVDKIARSNSMADPNNLTIGQTLVIPN